MATIDKAEFEKLVGDIFNEREPIQKHNPIGTGEEILLWMLMGCLASYLSLDPTETPCFPGRPTAETYRDAVRFMLRGRMDPDFDAEPYLAKLSQQ